jgi:hypothetical protein
MGVNLGFIKHRRYVLEAGSEDQAASRLFESNFTFPEIHKQNLIPKEVKA